MFALRILLLFLALFSLSQSSNLIRFAQAHSVVIAFYRSFFAFCLLSPFFVRDLMRISANFKSPELSRKTWQSLGLMTLMGVIFAVHFIAWIFAVQKTSISSAVICYSLTPLYTALLAVLLFRERIDRSLYVTMVLGMLGIYFIGAHDLRLTGEYIVGDLLSTFSSFLFAIYLLIGNRLRRFSPLQSFSLMMGLIYLVVSIVCFAIIWFGNLSFYPLDRPTWLSLGALAMFTTLLGHGSLIYLLRFFSASLISVLTLFEPLGAVAVAYFLWDEPVTASSLAGYVLISAGLVYLIQQQKKA